MGPRNIASTIALLLYWGVILEKQKMIETIALVCVGCGATVMRHPAMRLRRVVCLECVQKEKSKVKRARNEKRLAERKSGADASGRLPGDRVSGPLVTRSTSMPSPRRAERKGGTNVDTRA
jgi:hypothetical protein